MWTTYEHWQLNQLQRLAQADPERVETILNTVWNSYPGLLADLAIAAVDQEQLGVSECSELLVIPVEEVETRLREFRSKSSRFEYEWAVVVDAGKVAKLAESQICVWEIVREFRKLGSVERLTEAFPTLPKSELAAALVYAEQNPAEIEGQISRYEELIQKKRAEYPFTR
jgi:uncharacterized protein (DUF433 family)